MTMAPLVADRVVITGCFRFDPESHAVFWGVDNPGPLNAATRPDGNLYTCWLTSPWACERD
jgi:hypothetical protein